MSCRAMLRGNIILLTTVVCFTGTSSYASTAANDTVRNGMYRVETESKMHDLMDTDHGKFYGEGQRDDYKTVAPLTDEEKNKPKEWHPQIHQHYHAEPDTPDKE